MQPDSTDADIRTPRGLSFLEHACLLWLVILVEDEDGIPRVRRAKSRLMEILGSRSETRIRQALMNLEWRKLIRRVPDKDDHPTRPSTVVLSLRRMFDEELVKTCATCPRPVASTQGAKHCPRCRANISRHDRRWRGDAFEIWFDEVVRKGSSETKAVYRIHVVTGRPIFTREAEIPGEEGTGGIVDFMLGAGLLRDPAWLVRRRAHRAGEED